MQAKETVLRAIARELQNKKSSQGIDLNARALGLTLHEFGLVLEELLQENLISGVDIIKAGQCARPVEVYTGRVKITPRGRRWLEGQETGQ